MARSRAAGRPLWLITKYENVHGDVLTLYSGSDREVLPVFSFKEEAETFLQLVVPGMDWHVSETAVGELTSVLYGPYAGVKKVALDPLPVVECEALVDLVSLDRARFVRNLMGKCEPTASGERLLLAEASVCTDPSKP